MKLFFLLIFLPKTIDTFINAYNQIYTWSGQSVLEPRRKTDQSYKQSMLAVECLLASILLQSRQNSIPTFNKSSFWTLAPRWICFCWFFAHLSNVLISNNRLYSNENDNLVFGIRKHWFLTDILNNPGIHNLKEERYCIENESLEHRKCLKKNTPHKLSSFSVISISIQ